MRKILKILLSAWYWITGQLKIRRLYENIDLKNERLVRALGKYESREKAVASALRFDELAPIDIKVKVWVRKLREAENADLDDAQKKIMNIKTEILRLDRWIEENTTPVKEFKAPEYKEPKKEVTGLGLTMR